MNNIFGNHRWIVLTGNYGSGKTEIALNLAFDYAGSGQNTTLVDLDIVNPYFRSGEKAEEMKNAGIRVLMPTFALSTVDIPALPAEIQSVFEIPSDRVIFDVGGDDTGAAALGRYHHSFDDRAEQTMMALVVNCMRPLTQTAEDILDLAARIQARSVLKIGMLINNANLANQSTPEMLETGEKLLLNCAKQMGVNVVVNAGMPKVLASLHSDLPMLPMKRYMVPEWMEQ